MRQRSALAVVALVGLQAAAEAGPRVGLANLSKNGADGRAAIVKARKKAKRAGHELVASGPVRSALEDELPAAPDGVEAILDQALGLLAEGIDAYTDFRYAEVLDRAQKVDALLTGLVPNSDIVRTLAEAQLLIGLVHFGREAPERAMEAFRVVCRLQPDRAELDAGRYPPEVVDLFQRARKLEAGTEGVPLHVDTVPAGARVWVDGRLVGKSPVSAKHVAPGIHYVAVGDEDLEPSAGKVWVEPETGSRIELQPKPLPPAERILRIRRDTLAKPAEEVAWAQVANGLASHVTVDVLILVRDRDHGSFEAAFFDVRQVRLGPWIALPSAAFTRALQPAAGNELVLEGTLEPRHPRTRPWYRTWWGASLLVGGGMVVAGALALTISSASDERSYTIGEWCFDGGTCP